MGLETQLGGILDSKIYSEFSNSAAFNKFLIYF